MDFVSELADFVEVVEEGCGEEFFARAEGEHGVEVQFVGILFLFCLFCEDYFALFGVVLRWEGIEYLLFPFVGESNFAGTEFFLYFPEDECFND